MSREQKKEEGPVLSQPEQASRFFDQLPVEGWFWELVRRDERFKKRFRQIEDDAREYVAARLSPEEYGRKLKSYLVHLRRYGVHAAGLISENVPGAMTAEQYLLLPVPEKNRIFAVPRPAVAYLDFGDGLRPVPLNAAPQKNGFNRVQIRKLLTKYGLLEKKEPPEEPAAAPQDSDPV